MSDCEKRFSLSPVRVEYVSSLSIRLCSMEPWLTLGYTPEVFEFYLLQSDPALARNVVLISGEVAGVVSLRNPWLFGPLIELLALFEGFRGQGIGRSILDWIGERYPANNLWVTVSSFNLRAQRFYEKAGFEKTAILEDLIKPGWEEILLRKQMRQQER